MAKAKKELENKAQDAVRKATEAVKAANDALNEANIALSVMKELSDDELDQVAGGTSEWSSVPKENEYPIPPDINP